jgi:hypothetical protein
MNIMVDGIEPSATGESIHKQFAYESQVIHDGMNNLFGLFHLLELSQTEEIASQGSHVSIAS